MPTPVTHGTVVTIRGLGSNTMLNGRYGRVVGVQGERIVVEISGVGRKAIKGENLRRVGPVRAWCHSCGGGVIGSVGWEGEVTCDNCANSFLEVTRNEAEFEQAREFQPERPAQRQQQLLFPIPFPFPFMGMGLSEEDILFRLHQESVTESSPTRPPASRSFIASLPTVPAPPSTACPICQDDFTPEEPTLKLPCNHHYHKDCLTPWLDTNNTCPTCRHELPTDDMEYERERGRSVPATILDA